MAMVISPRSKVVTVLVVAGFGLVLVLIIGGTVGWFDAHAAPDYSFPRSNTEKFENSINGKLVGKKCCKGIKNNKVRLESAKKIEAGVG